MVEERIDAEREKEEERVQTKGSDGSAGAEIPLSFIKRRCWEVFWDRGTNLFQRSRRQTSLFLLENGE